MLLPFSSFSVHPSGGKRVMGKGLVSSFISWHPVCSSLCYQGWTAEAVGLWDRISALSCLSGCPLYGLRAKKLGAPGENESVLCVYSKLWGQRQRRRHCGQAWALKCLKLVAEDTLLKENISWFEWTWLPSARNDSCRCKSGDESTVSIVHCRGNI